MQLPKLTLRNLSLDPIEFRPLKVNLSLWPLQVKLIGLECVVYYRLLFFCTYCVRKTLRHKLHPLYYCYYYYYKEKTSKKTRGDLRWLVLKTPKKGNEAWQDLSAGKHTKKGPPVNDAWRRREENRYFNYLQPSSSSFIILIFLCIVVYSYFVILPFSCTQSARDYMCKNLIFVCAVQSTVTEARSDQWW